MILQTMMALTLAVSQPNGDAADIDAAAEAFGALPASSRLDVSPDGRFLARRVVHKGEYALRIDPLTDEGKAVLWAPADKASLGRFSWTADNELLVISEKLAVTHARSMAAGEHRSKVYYDFFQAKRPRVMRSDGKTVTELTFRKLGDIRSFSPLANTELVSGTLPTFIHTENAKGQYEEKFRPAEVSLRKNDYDFLAPPIKASGVFAFYGDPTGTTMLARHREFGASDQTLYRRVGGRWSEVDGAFLRGHTILQVLDAQTVLVRSTSGSLLRYDLDAGTMATPIYRGTDRAWPVMAPGSAAILGIAVGGDDGSMQWLDEAEEAAHRAAEAAIGSGPLTYVDASHDGAVRIVSGYTDDGIPADFVYAPDRGLLKTFDQAGDKDAYERPTVRTLTYTARDGLTIEGFLSHPPDAEPGTLPLVVMPHGGPAARDTTRYNAWRSYLTALGYAVFQPNFRGSTGYGKSFADAGRGEWGAAMQHDIVDGVAHLVGEGLADDGRLAIMGGSYGGYAALMGTLDDTPYRCAVSINGVTDLNGMLLTEQVGIGYDYWDRHIRGDGLSEEELARRSPLARAAEIDIPVLLIHGVLDTTVRKGQTAALVNAMEEAGGDVTAVYLDRSDHYLEIEGERQRAFAEAGKFLADCLP